MANRRFVTRAPKRRVSWEGAMIDASDLVVATPQFFAVIPEAALEQFPNPTIVRTRGKLGVFTDVSSTPGGFGIVTMGLIVVTSTALAASAIPLPATDIGSDWLWWDQGIVGAAAGDVIGEEITIDRVTVDSKAMRKIGLNHAVVLAMQLQTCESTMVANVCGNLRFLLKAP